MFFKKKKKHHSKEASDFPIMDNHSDIIFLDNACTTLKPRPVIDSISNYYTELGSCALRSPHKLGKETTKAVFKARKTIANFLGLSSPEEVIFTRGATDSINLLAQSYKFEQGDEVVVSSLEHNSNLLPWLGLSERSNLKVHIWDIDPEGRFDLNELESLLAKKEVKLLSLFSDSNIISVDLPIEQIVDIAHKYNVLVHIDASQSLLHREVNFSKFDIDFMSFSFHKLMGPTGIGVLALKKKNYERLTPVRLGGEAVVNVTEKSYILSDVPACFEPGVGSYSEILGAAAAIDYISSLGYKFIQDRDRELASLLYEGISSVKEINILGPDRNSHLINFYLGTMDSGELSILLDKNFGIMTRAGVHCGHYWFNKYRLNPSLRVSAAFYNRNTDIEILVNALKEMAGSFL